MSLLSRCSLRNVAKYVLRSRVTAVLAPLRLTMAPANIALKHTYEMRARHRGKKIQQAATPSSNPEEDASDDDGYLNDVEYNAIVSSAMHVSSRLVEQQVLVIQPYIKWGAKRLPVKPDHQLQEAEALIRSIPGWLIVESMKVGLETLDKRNVFGTGKLEELRGLINQLCESKKRPTAVFVSKSMLSRRQKVFLEQLFQMPVLDRYSVVVQILRLHATSAEAKLQVAMAEIPYIWQQMRDLDSAGLARAQLFFTDAQKEMLKRRERKIKEDLDRIRSQRSLLRRKRLKKNFPIIAVVGYTNAGKTSLIKALTDEASLQPRDQLFATLDVTSHAGFLPCNLEVLYMDTVGFMSDLPTGLIECFIATLEDAMLADVILHVQDVAHDNYAQQKLHVEDTLKRLRVQASSEEGATLPPIIDVGNKVDLLSEEALKDNFKEQHLVSSTTKAGIADLVLQVEQAVLQATNRQKMVIRLRNGGPESAWLYKNAAVTLTEADPNDPESLLMHIVISQASLGMFRSQFIRK